MTLIVVNSIFPRAIGYKGETPECAEARRQSDEGVNTERMDALNVLIQHRAAVAAALGQAGIDAAALWEIESLLWRADSAADMRDMSGIARRIAASIARWRAAIKNEPVSLLIRATPPTDTNMGEAMRLVLPVMLKAGAVADSGTWLKKERIAKETGYKVDSLHKPMADAVRDRLLISKPGRVGGYQLAANGMKRAAKMG